MRSRRGILVLTGTLVAGAGCTRTRTEQRPQVVCSTGIFAGGGDVVFGLTPQVSSDGGGETPTVELTIPVRKSVLAAETVDLIEVRSGEELRHRIPVDPVNDDPVGDVQRYDSDDVVEYTQSLGPVPHNDRLRLVALDGDGQRVDELGLEFRCYREDGAATE